MSIGNKALWLAVAGLLVPELSGAKAEMVETQQMQHVDIPIVIAHRGASGYRPEHTLGAYELAIEMGADYVEPDLVMTRDGHFVARHDVYLSGTTDVAERPEFASRKRTLNGKTDWFVFDFTLAELKTLRAVQPRPKRGQQFDKKEEIPTLQEVIDLVKGRTVGGRQVGLHIELKRPDVFAQFHSDTAEGMLRQLEQVKSAGIPLFFQCFDPMFAVKLAERTDIPVVLLVDGISDGNGWYKPETPIEPYIAKVDGFGVYKHLLINKDGSSTGMIERLKGAGKEVHIWTIRDDQLPDGFANVEEELTLYYKLGIDGVFSDFPDTALKAREAWLKKAE